VRELCEIEYPQDTEAEEMVMVKERYFLLHFGLKFEIVNDIGVSYTVAVCQNIKTGQIECFAPERLRILGTEIRK